MMRVEPTRVGGGGGGGGGSTFRALIHPHSLNVTRHITRPFPILWVGLLTKLGVNISFIALAPHAPLHMIQKKDLVAYARTSRLQVYQPTFYAHSRNTRNLCTAAQICQYTISCCRRCKNRLWRQEIHTGAVFGAIAPD